MVLGRSLETSVLGIVCVLIGGGAIFLKGHSPEAYGLVFAGVGFFRSADNKKVDDDKKEIDLLNEHVRTLYKMIPERHDI